MGIKSKVKISAVGACFGAIGVVMLWYSAGTLTAIAVFVMLWAHNLEMHSK